MSSESLGEFEKVRTQLPQSHAGGSVHFSWQHFIKRQRAVHGAPHCAPNLAIFTPTDTQGKPRPCLIYDARHEKDFSNTLGKEEWESREGVTERRGSFTDNSNEAV